jgi:hypothetical protein
VHVVARVADVVEARAPTFEEAGGPAGGAGLGDEDLHLGLTLADGEEVVERLLGREVAAVGPVRAGLVEVEPERVAEDLAGLVDGGGHEADVVDVDETHGTSVSLQAVVPGTFLGGR